MKSISIFNDVLGPVMRGPSSSHTAGSFNLARIAVDLLGERPTAARLAFDPSGSYARVYREQGVDRAFAVGLLGWPLTDARFFSALDVASSEGLDLRFEVSALEHADHPNAVEITLKAGGRTLTAQGRSIGGGLVEMLSVDGWPVRLTGETWEVLVEADSSHASDVAEWLRADGQAIDVDTIEKGSACLVHARRLVPLPSGALAAPELRKSLRQIRPLAFIKRGAPFFDSAKTAVELANAESLSLGRLALAHEASVVGISGGEAAAEMERRLDVMIAAVDEGLSQHEPAMQLLQPSAHKIFEAEAAGRLAMGGAHTRAAARALAAMHVNSSMGVVCAAPTGGSAGVLPAVVFTLLEGSAAVGRGFSLAVNGSLDLPVNGSLSRSDRERAVWALFAAGAVGVVVASRATFAAEIAGCQVEIGAAGAMAAAAVVEAAGGTAEQAADAAAIAFQNTMGSVCDLVQGVVEIPCHTRNAVAASSAFVCADLVLGGYRNPIPLDETIDAVLSVGKMLPSELRCTARGGLAVTPSALTLRKK